MIVIHKKNLEAACSIYFGICYFILVSMDAANFVIQAAAFHGIVSCVALFSILHIEKLFLKRGDE